MRSRTPKQRSAVGSEMPRIVSTLTLGAILAFAVTQSALAEKQLKGKSMATISVEFSDDCTLATIESSKDIGNISVVLTNGAWEKFEQPSGGPTYTVGIAADGPNKGEAIRMLYVKSGSFRQQDLMAVIPGHVGFDFECVPVLAQ